jgi:hypothetical protein
VCSSSCTTSGAGSSITLRLPYSGTTARARTTLTTSDRPGSGCRRCWRRPTQARVRRSPPLRPHLDPAVHRMALPRCSSGGTRAGPGHLGAHSAGPVRQQHRRQPPARHAGARSRNRARRHRRALRRLRRPQPVSSDGKVPTVGPARRSDRCSLPGPDADPVARQARPVEAVALRHQRRAPQTLRQAGDT